MIIECPACTTRYDIKAELPPEGRSVRCAKCGTVWRAMPETPEEVEESHEEAWEPHGAEQESHDRSAGEESERQHYFAPGHAYDREWPREDGGAAVEENHAEHDESAYAESGEEPGPALPEQREEETGSSKVSWFGSFRGKRQSKTGAEDVASGPELGSAEPIPFPRATFPPEAPAAGPGEEELRTLEDARQAVRSVFSNLGNGRSSAGARALSPAVAATAAQEEGDERRAAERQADEAPIHGAASHVAAETPAYLNWTSDAANAIKWESGARDLRAASAESKAPSFGLGAADSETGDWRAPQPASADESDNALREAMKAYFPASAPSGSPAPHQELAQQLESHLRAASVPAEAPRKPAALWDRAPPEPAEIEEEPADGVAAFEEAVEKGDDDAAFDQRLYREIEETQEKTSEARSGAGRGGLALLAAWGLFVCVASGLAVGFVSFRDIVADAVPGLAPLYRTLGIPVTIQPLVFEGVQYEWKVVDFKPVLVVSGNVVNRADREVPVPKFFVAVKDQNPALDSEYPANLGIGPKIGAHEHASFDIQLLAPSPTITSVELELRNVH
jgi:predicted Zn finger-like uncharacterized protein